MGLALGNAIGLGFLNLGQVSDAPNPSELVYHLDGTINGDELVDIINGYNFTINNKDFDSDSYGGIPFKTAATISAPSSGDAKAAVLAIDVNNFWYDSGGTPNQIPITSFFQNIDFANQLFCRHTEREVNSDQEEITPPLVTDICGYASTQNITGAYTAYFGTDIERPTSNVLFVSKEGNDTTGDGSWSTPFLTIDKAISEITNGHDIWVLTGEYTEDSGSGYLSTTRQITINVKGAGNCYLKSTNETRVASHVHYTTNHIDWCNFRFEGKQFYNTRGFSIYKSQLNGLTKFSGDISIYDSTRIGSSDLTIGDDAEIQGCYLSGSKHTLNGGNFYYNKLVVDGNHALTVGNSGLSALTGANIRYNLFDVQNTDYAIQMAAMDLSVNDYTLNIERNKLFKSGESGSCVPMINIEPNDIDAPGTYFNYINIRYNEFYDNTETGVNEGLQCVLMVEGSQLLYDPNDFSVRIEYNYLKSLNNHDARSGFILNPDSMRGKVAIKYNRIFMNSNEGQGIGFGEGGGTGITAGSEIIGNYLQGVLKNYPSSSGGFHGMLINGNVDFHIKYNWLEYCQLAYVIKDKGGNGTYTEGGMYYNVSFNNKAHFYWRGLYGVPCIGNTFVNNSEVSLSRFGAMDAQGYDSGNACRGHFFKNNIFSYVDKLNPSSAHFMVGVAGLDGTDDIVFNDNIFDLDSNHTLFITDDAGTPNTYTYAQSVTNGWVLNGEEASPSFEGLSTGDLRLATGSAGIDDGTTLAAAYEDGLHAITNWNTNESDSDVDNFPNIVTSKHVGSAWDKGAYANSKLPSQASAAFSLVGSNLGTGINKWNDGVLANNGKVYCSPYRATQVLEIDPEDGSTTLFGSLSSDFNKWYNLIKANDGLLYGIPSNVSDVLEVNPVTHGINTYPGATSPIATAVKWVDAILASNGKIYGIPNRAQDVIEFDPVTKGITLFGGFTDNVSKWSKGALASDGKIYASPIQTETTILEIDPTTPSAITRSISISGTNSYNDCIHVNGKIYLTPFNASGIGVFDISTKEFSTIGNFAGESKFNHSVLANGKIYMIPRKVNYVLELDPTTGQTTTFGNVGDPDVDLKWNKAVLGDNGKIYAFPAYNWNTILEIDPVGHSALEFENIESTATFRWSYCTKAGNGKIYGVPQSIDYVAQLIPF